MVNYVCVLDLGGKSETPFHCGQTPFGCGLRICGPHQDVVFTTLRCGHTPSRCGKYHITMG